MRTTIEKPIFNKKCKHCGNQMGVRMSKITENGESWVECEVTPGSDGKPSCYLLGDSTVLSGGNYGTCTKKYRCYHRAYGVEARLWQ